MTSSYSSRSHYDRDKMAAIFQTIFHTIFKCIFFKENVRISIKIPMTLILKGPINNIPSWVQIMAWHRPGAKPLSEPMMHIYVTLPQWFNLTYHPIHWSDFSWNYRLKFILNDPIKTRNAPNAPPPTTPHPPTTPTHTSTHPVNV